MKKVVRIHNLDSVKLFNDGLKPKMHFLVHYPSIIKQCGPPRNFWCFGFESKNKDFKTYARVITSRTNIPLTLAIKAQLKFAHYLLTQDNVQLYSVVERHKRLNTMHPEVVHNFKNRLKINNQFHAYSQCRYRGKTFKSSYYLCQHLPANHTDARVYRILEIIIFDSLLHPYVVCKRMNVKYLPHYAAIQLDINDMDSGEIVMFCVTNCAGPPLNTHTVSRGH